MIKDLNAKTKQYMNVAFEAGKIETKEENGVEFGYFEGYASTFGNLDRARDIVERGAFKDTLADGNTVQCLWVHNSREILGSYPTMYEDDKGLFVRGRLNLAVQKSKEAYALLKAGDINSLSIGYFIKEYEIIRSETEYNIYRLKKLDLSEISLVGEPCNLEATITGVKSLESLEQVEKLSDIENILKSNGFSNKESETLISKVKNLCLGDPNEDLQGDLEEKQLEEIKKRLSILRDINKLIEGD